MDSSATLFGSWTLHVSLMVNHSAPSKFPLQEDTATAHKNDLYYFTIQPSCGKVKHAEISILFEIQLPKWIIDATRFTSAQGPLMTFVWDPSGEILGFWGPQSAAIG